MYELPGEVLEFPWMNIMLSGEVEYIVNGRPVVLTEGHVLYFRTGETVSRREQYADVRYLSIRFTTDYDDSSVDTCVPILGERQKALVDLLQDYYFSSDLEKEENRKAAEYVLELIIMELRKNCNHTEINERISAIRNCVLRNFGDGISSRDVARHLGLNASYCNTVYKNATGETVGQFIDQTRFRHAVSRLMYSQRSVEEIARECGFRDTYYFSRWFRRRTDLSPTDFRIANREKPPF